MDLLPDESLHSRAIKRLASSVTIFEILNILYLNNEIINVDLRFWESCDLFCLFYLVNFPLSFRYRNLIKIFKYTVS